MYFRKWSFVSWSFFFLSLSLFFCLFSSCWMWDLGKMHFHTISNLQRDSGSQLERPVEEKDKRTKCKNQYQYELSVPSWPKTCNPKTSFLKGLGYTYENLSAKIKMGRSKEGFLNLMSNMIFSTGRFSPDYFLNTQLT